MSKSIKLNRFTKTPNIIRDFIIYNIYKSSKLILRNTFNKFDTNYYTIIIISSILPLNIKFQNCKIKKYVIQQPKTDQKCHVPNVRIQRQLNQKFFN
jgi:hypothetical protein